MLPDCREISSMDVRTLAGVVFKHFTARDMICRWDAVDAASNATASSAARFIDSIITRMPFPIIAIQVDEGSEFQSIFEEGC
ncbi:hypothetical protein ACFLXC_03545 [Chloroflexota bacterium]